MNLAVGISDCLWSWLQWCLAQEQVVAEVTEVVSMEDLAATPLHTLWDLQSV